MYHMHQYVKLKHFGGKMEKKKYLTLNLIYWNYSSVLAQFYLKVWLSVRELFSVHHVSTAYLKFISNDEILIHFFLPTMKKQPKIKSQSRLLYICSYK